MRCILVRHCETDWNLAGRIQGRTDIPLNATGRRQAIELAKRLSDLGITHVLGSTLLRAQETAYVIAHTLGLAIRLDDRLQECAFGTIEGKTHLEIPWIRSPEYASSAPYDFRPFGGEHAEAVLTRHRSLLDEFIAAHPPHDVPLIVGHGCGLGTLLTHLGQPSKLTHEEYRDVSYF